MVHGVWLKKVARTVALLTCLIVSFAELVKYRNIGYFSPECFFCIFRTKDWCTCPILVIQLLCMENSSGVVVCLLKKAWLCCADDNIRSDTK